RNLETVPPWVTTATGVNGRLEVAGRGDPFFSPSPVFSTAEFWSEATGLIDVGALSGGAVSAANAINDDGQIAGSMGIPGLPAVRSRGLARLWRGRQPRWPGGPRSRLRDVEPRARDRDHTWLDLSRRVDLQAVRRRVDRAPRAGRQARVH